MYVLQIRCHYYFIYITSILLYDEAYFLPRMITIDEFILFVEFDDFFL